MSVAPIRRAQKRTLLLCAALACPACDGGERSEGEAEAESESEPAESEPEREGEARVGIGDPNDATFVPLPADGAIPLFPGPQGGYHVWLQFRARGLDPTYVWCERKFVEPAGGVIVVEQREGRGMIAAEDGWTTYEFALQTFVCPSSIPGQAVHDRAFDLDAVLTDADEVTAHVRTKILPTCPEDDPICRTDTTFGCAAP